MKSLFERKLKFYESLLMITEEMSKKVHNDDYEALADLSASRQELIQKIISIDKKINETVLSSPINGQYAGRIVPAGMSGTSQTYGIETSKIKALIERTADTNKWLIAAVREKSVAVNAKLGNLGRASEATSQYAKISAI